MSSNIHSIQSSDRATLRRVIVSAIMAITLTACQAHGPTAPSTQVVSAEWTAVQSQAAAMEVEVGSATSRLALLRLSNALDAAYAVYDLAPPLPAIRIVSKRHPIMDNITMAKAAVTAGGDELIYFNRAHLSNPRAIEPLVMHEVAHLKAWREHGFTIQPHGPEFKAICRAASARRNCNARR